MKPQTVEIFEHLKRHGSITPAIALREYHSMRLAARIQELREAGYAIETVIRTHKRRGEVVRFAEYRYHASRSAA